MPPWTIGNSVWRSADWPDEIRPNASRQRIEPPNAALRRVSCHVQARLPRNDVVELHDHVSAEILFDAHHRLGSEPAPRAVEVASEIDTVLVDCTQRLQREHLKSAGVGDDRPVPAHEPVEASQVADYLIAGTEMQVIGVGEDHPRAGGMDLRRIERLDGGEGADRHERRRFDGAVWCHEQARPRAPGGRGHGKREGSRRRRVRHVTSMASPYEKNR